MEARASRLEERAAALRKAAAEAVARGGGGESESESESDVGEARKLLEQKAQVVAAASKARKRAAANRALAAKLLEAVERAKKRK